MKILEIHNKLAVTLIIFMVLSQASLKSVLKY